MSDLPVQMIRALHEGERVIWTGKPVPEVSSWPLHRLLITLCLITVVGVIFAMIAFGGRSLGQWMAPVIVVAAVAATGVSLCAVHNRSEKGRLTRTTYAVTSNRVLAFEAGLHSEPRIVEIDRDIPSLCEPNTDGTVSIWLRYRLMEDPVDLDRKSKIDREVLFDGLERLADHQAALDALTDAFATKLAGGLDRI